MKFLEKLTSTVRAHNSLVCVGLDPDSAKLPVDAHDQLFEFNKAIIDATAEYAAFFKPNTAFYEAKGAYGIEQLKATCDYVKAHYETPIIIDAKRGDIGNTNAQYAAFIFDYLGADATTVQPYQGAESLRPFFDRDDKGIFVLAKTSNPDAAQFQDLTLKGKPLYEHVVETFKTVYPDNCYFVAGATSPDQLSVIRSVIGDDPLLVPGIGAQGGSIEEVVGAGQNRGGEGLIISASRSIIFASSGRDFAEKAGQEAAKLRNAINTYRKAEADHD